ncbi:hypothetical protein JB92DRAFT_2789643 [Gautieria morchelliformis]|nr:hypothetical protein JB92DRAFT_2789643 [Gautieria morchelliformis]
MTPNPELDPYTSQAENTDVTLQEKINGSRLKEIIEKVQTSMLTTRSRGDHLHSRAMTPTSDSLSGNNLHFFFIGNNASGKFDEIENDDHVNVSFFEPSSTDWASITGVARISKDKELIKKHWSTVIAGYFGDLGDGTHKGNEDDPRVSIIKVVPDEIRYWTANKGKLGQTVQVAIGAVTGKSQAPGELRTITKDEIEVAERLHQK